MKLYLLIGLFSLTSFADGIDSQKWDQVDSAKTEIGCGDSSCDVTDRFGNGWNVPCNLSGPDWGCSCNTVEGDTIVRHCSNGGIITKFPRRIPTPNN